MGRPQKEFDIEAALDLLMRGESIPSVAGELSITPPTLRARIAEIQKEQGLLLQYRSIQSLQLTALQARILEAITPGKIEEAPLKDLVASYKILKDKELVIENKPSEIKGLVAHLIYMEKQEQALAAGTQLPDLSITDAEYTDSTNDEGQVTSINEIDEQDF
jgi:hypothetical protein